MKPQRPKEPDECIWETTKISEEILHDGDKSDDLRFDEYTEIRIEDKHGNPLDFVKITKYKHEMILNPDYDEQLDDYAEQMYSYLKMDS